MVRFPEFVQTKAPPGTTAMLNERAEAEGKRVSDVVREAVMAHLTAGSRNDSTDMPKAA